MNSGKRRLAFALSMAISAVFLVLAFRGLQPEQFLSSLTELDLPLLAVAAIVYFVAVVVIALRWQFLLRAVKRVPLASLCQLVFIGYMGNNVYPLRAGDALRIVLLRRNHAVPIVRGTTIVIIERLFDGCVMLTFIIFSLLFINLQSPEVEAIVEVTTPLFIIALAIALFLAAKPHLLQTVIKALVGVIPQRPGQVLAEISEDIIAGLEGLRSPLFLLGAVISSLVTWGIEASRYRLRCPR